MDRPPAPFRRSIWCHDRRYDVDPSKWSTEDLNLISRLTSVEAAKKQIPPIAPSDLIQLAELARAMPKSIDVQRSELERFLQATSKLRGAGIITSICMLSVLTDGDYAPMDRKIAAGFFAKQKITQEQCSSLLGSNCHRFCDAYVQSVLPAWRGTLKSMSAHEADNYWGSAG